MEIGSGGGVRAFGLGSVSFIIGDRVGIVCIGRLAVEDSEGGRNDIVSRLAKV